MLNQLEDYIKEAEAFNSTHKQEVEDFRIKFLGKKGILNELFANFKTVPPEDKKSYGQQLNLLKNIVEEKVQNLKSEVNSQDAHASNQEDITKPPFPVEIGARHPINKVKNKIINIFSRVGFTLSDGPEIEDDWHNFTALNLPEYHPARDMQDTFFIEQGGSNGTDILLRTHTSSVQIRHMEQFSPPIRILSPGRVYRNEAISARSHSFFHQIEGLYIDKDVSFSDLKQIIQYFTKELFGKSEIRMRPSYFPFTEPSCEIDVYWGLETETDYRITKGTGWLEIMGGGMVDPQVLSNMNINSEEYSGYAFGMGIERIVMLLFQIEDIRMFSENDIRMLQQFKTIN